MLHSVESLLTMSRRPLSVLMLAFAAVAAAAIVVRAGQAAQIPSGPSVRVSDGWYHLDDCSIAVGRQAPSMPLADALRKSQRPCPICEPLLHQPEWAEFVKAHGETIAAEVKAKAEADAAEAKRKLEAEEADRVRRLKELEDERKRKETAPVVRLTEAQAREIAKAASAEANGDPVQFQTRFRARVRELAPEYAGPQIVYGSGVLKIYAAGPVARFELSAVDRLQKRLPITGAVWAPDVAIVVAPESVDAPDIKQIVVQRSDAHRPAGAETQATVLGSTLAPRKLPGAPATASSVNAGDVVFPLSVFEPGEGVVVRVIAVPSSGANLSKTFTLMALRAIQ
jgi:hypothetical protein